MTKLADILDETRLFKEIDAGFIRAQFHPEFPYCILNYTEKAQYENRWNNETIQCRGLIYNTRTDEVVARPLPKFFNYSQLTLPPPPETVVVTAMDKLDGSLGIFFHAPDGTPHVATRGSFTSDQALWATKWLQEHPDVYNQDQYLTVLVEILYPQNRIVCDYGDRAELVLLGAMDKEFGSYWPVDTVPETIWKGARTQVFEFDTLADVLNAPNRENAEGLVVYTADEQLIKFKQDDYVKLHRILTGLTERTIHDLLVSNQSIEDFIELVPDEFHDWVRQTASNLNNEHYYLIAHWEVEYQGIIDQLPENATQKDFALLAKDSPCKSAMFLIHKNDTERLHELAWKEIQPPATKATSGISDD